MRGRETRPIPPPCPAAAALPVAPAAARRRWRKSPAGAAMAADHDVLAYRQGSKQREVLERAADAERGDAVDRVARQRAPLEPNRAVVEAVEARETVEQRGLACAIGPDQAADFATRDVEADLIERDHAAEPHGDAFDGQHLH